MSATRRLMLALLLAALALPGANASAQSPSPSVRMIPLSSPGYHLRLSPDGSTAAVFTDPAIVNDEVAPGYLPIDLIDIASGRRITRISDFTDYAADVAFSPDGTRLASVHTNGQLNIWDLTAAVPRPLERIDTTFVAAPQRIAFTPDGGTVVTMLGGIPGRFVLWDTTTGAPTAILGPTFQTYADFYTHVESVWDQGDMIFTTFAISPDGTTLATATQNEEIALWSIPGGVRVIVRPASEKKLMLGIRSLAFSPDGGSLLYVDPTDGRAHVWDIATAAESRSLPIGGTSFAVSPDWSRLAWATTTDSATAIHEADLANPDRSQQVADIPLRLPMTMASLAFTPDGKELVVGGFASPGEEGKNGIAVISLE